MPFAQTGYVGQTAVENQRPELRKDLVVRSIRYGPKRYFEVRTENSLDDTGRALRFSCSGYSVAALLNGKRTLHEVLDEARDSGIELNMKKLRGLVVRLSTLGCLVEGGGSIASWLDEDTTEDKPTIVVSRSKRFSLASPKQETPTQPRRHRRFPSLPPVQAPKTGELRNYAHQLGSGLREPVPASALFVALCACAAAGAWAGWALLRLL